MARRVQSARQGRDGPTDNFLRLRKGGVVAFCVSLFMSLIVVLLNSLHRVRTLLNIGLELLDSFSVAMKVGWVGVFVLFLFLIIISN